MSLNAIRLLLQFWNTPRGSLSFDYLGVPLFKGAPRRVHLQKITDKIKNKLSAWKGNLLSMAGRLTLIKSVIEISFIYSFWVYKWPDSLIKELNKCIRKFLWTKSLFNRKLDTVAWKKVCQPIEKGGLGLPDLKINNGVFQKKFAWDLVSTDSLASKFLRSRYLLNRMVPREFGVCSSILPGMKNWFKELSLDIRWAPSDNSKLYFWKDNWLGYAILDKIIIDNSIKIRLRATISDFRIDDS